MRKIGYINFLVCLALLLFATIIFWSARTDPKALDREMGVMGPLHNSLYYLDQAKWKWAEEKHKSEHDTPTMDDLAPYLGKWTNTITRFEALGIKYTITPLSEMEAQSDIATFTREVYFHVGFCRYYPTGCTMSLHNGWSSPRLDAKSKLRAFYFADRELLAVAIFVLSTINLLVLAVVKLFAFVARRKLKPLMP